MKKLILLAVVLFTTVACQDINQLEEAPVINLGVKATDTKIVSAVTSGSKVTVMYSVTAGAKYSVQIYKFGESSPVKTLPLTADSSIVTKVYELTDLDNGIYDLTLTDISGTSIKQPLIIKR